MDGRKFSQVVPNFVAHPAQQGQASGLGTLKGRRVFKCLVNLLCLAGKHRTVFLRVVADVST
jgi:hypothetical protein